MQYAVPCASQLLVAQEGYELFPGCPVGYGNPVPVGCHPEGQTPEGKPVGPAGYVLFAEMDGNPEVPALDVVEELDVVVELDVVEELDEELNNELDDIVARELVVGATVALWVGAPPAQYPRQAAT